MQLLIFSLEFPPRVGGLEWMAYQLARNFHLAGNQIVVVSLYQPKDQEFDALQPFRIVRTTSAMDENTTIDKLKQKRAMYSILESEIKTFKPEAILCPHWDPCGYLAWMVTLGKPKIPYFVIGHGTELSISTSKLLSRTLKYLLRWITFTQALKVFAVSHFTSERIMELGVPKNKIVIIPNGIDSKDIVPRSTDSNPHGGPRLLTICRLVKRKGCDTVIQSLPYLIEKYPKIEYWIVGEGAERKFLEDQVKTLRLECYVKFWGLVHQNLKEEIFLASDVFVMPVRQTSSDFEGFGIVFLEAMAHGVPVIGSNTGGIPDVIEDGVTGLLVPPDDPQVLAHVIDEVLSDGSRRQSMVLAALQRVNDRFRWDLIAAEYIRQMRKQA